MALALAADAGYSPTVSCRYHDAWSCAPHCCKSAPKGRRHWRQEPLRQSLPASAGSVSSSSRPETQKKEAVAYVSRLANRRSWDQKKGGVDYSKFANLEDSDDDQPVAQKSLTIPMGLPREAVSREEYENVWMALLRAKDLPLTPVPDLDVMWSFYCNGGMDEQALLDQACEVLLGLPNRLSFENWKANSYTLMWKLQEQGRDDEARMWSLIHVRRFPQDADAYYNQGVLLSKICDKARFSGSSTMKLHSLDGHPSKFVSVMHYCNFYTKASLGYYRKCLQVDPKSRCGYINIIGCLERNEPPGWYDDVHKVAADAVRHGIWYDIWQRPPHFVGTLSARPWHEAQSFSMCLALEQNARTIADEYEAYVSRLANRRNWDDLDITPGLAEVGGREGALHDGGLKKGGSWREVPLFANGAPQQEYLAQFPQTARVLREHCGDATGLALCYGGDVIFSVLSPGTALRPHCGPSNARLTCHLGIRVPFSAEQGCWLRVAATPPQGWQEGKCIVFDDSFEHEVQFKSVPHGEPHPGDRVVLLLNFWHPFFEFKNDPQWRTRSDSLMAKVAVEHLPQTSVALQQRLPD